MSTETTQERTGLGNYFVANYPPFYYWKPEHLTAAREALDRSPTPGTPLGLYLHIPFCRKRCKFCYFRVYTEKNARDVDTYLGALIKEVELYGKTKVVGGRPLHYVYFGGGTPSYLSVTQLRGLVDRLQQVFSFHAAAEVTFECEPGTLQQPKLEALRALGVTRLSLGIEHFHDAVLEANGRAHLSAEIYRAYSWARDLDFPQINIDLIAGMVGDSWESWRDCVQKTLQLAPDSVTIYQMELPFNTVFSKELRVVGHDQPGTFDIADWPTKRAWVDYAFKELAQAGYSQSSAYTMIKDRGKGRFVYRDSLWHGADMFGTGVASFGHVQGVHLQNVDRWEDYLERLQQGELPLGRALPVTPQERLIREMILQLKTGRIETRYFQDKFGVAILSEFREPFGTLARRGIVTLHDDAVEVTRAGLLEIDRHLPEFFLPEHRGSRYT